MFCRKHQQLKALSAVSQPAAQNMKVKHYFCPPLHADRRLKKRFESLDSY